MSSSLALGAGLLSLKKRASLITSLALEQKKEEDASPLGDVDHLLVVAGNSDEENPYRKGSALQVSASWAWELEPR